MYFVFKNVIYTRIRNAWIKESRYKIRSDKEALEKVI